LGDIAGQLGFELIGNPDLRITRIGPLEGATPSTISFLSHPKYQPQLAASKAACVIVNATMRESAVARGAAMVASDAYLAFARLTQWWAAQTRSPVTSGVHASAVVHPTVRLGSDVSVGAFSVIEAWAVIESGAAIGAHGYVGANAHVGAATRLAARVTLGAGCRIGERCIVHSGVVIGADGFGFAPTEGRWEKIEQLGNVRIGNDVEIGANSCIDRGALDDTVIEDNLVQIGHNVRIGAHSALAGCAGVAGSAVIGAHCTVGGGAIVLGHLTLADHVHISAASVVMRAISKPGTYSGVFPIDDNSSWEKNAATLRQLHSLRDRVRALENTQVPTQEKIKTS
jgi:UDP-3-O-[3-hydroxymyristoyl] glucosamine N-acyltransferase